MTNDQELLNQEANRIRSLLTEMPFDQCCPLSREFAELPNRPGLYALKHQRQGILYIGKSGNVRSRLRGGHKALGWAFIDRMNPDEVRIAAAILAFPWTRLSLQLEGIVLRQTRPPYNNRIAQED
jgi:excinuclease UvrABC nuclease subunit